MNDQMTLGWKVISISVVKTSDQGQGQGQGVLVNFASVFNTYSPTLLLDRTADVAILTNLDDDAWTHQMYSSSLIPRQPAYKYLQSSFSMKVPVCSVLGLQPS